MRWAYEGVIFEPSGVDHTSPGSSFVVGGQIVREVFGAEPPIGPMYAFVGISGMAKMSSSRGRRADRRRTRCPSWRPRCCAGCTPGAGPTSPSRSRSTRRSSACTTSGTRSVARWPPAPPRTATRRVHPGHRHGRGRPAADHAAPRALPDAGVHRGRDHRRRRADAADPARPRPGRPGRPRSTRCGPGWTRRPAWVRHAARPAEQRTHGARPSPTSALLADLDDTAARVAAAAGGRAGRRTGRWTGSPRSSTACRRGSSACRWTSSRRPSSRSPSGRSSPCSTPC